MPRADIFLKGLTIQTELAQTLLPHPSKQKTEIPQSLQINSFSKRHGMALLLSMASFITVAVLERLPHKTQAKYHAEMTLLAVAVLLLTLGLYPLVNLKKAPGPEIKHCHEPIMLVRGLARGRIEARRPITPEHVIHSRVMARISAHAASLAPGFVSPDLEQN
jgi:hypothetical protein